VIAKPSPVQTFLVQPENAGERLDRYLAARLPEMSRTRIGELIDAGEVRVSGAAVKAAHKLRAGEEVTIRPAPRPSLDAVAEALPLEILYADDHVVVVNKPAGMTVHAGAGKSRGTLVNALMHHLGKLSTVGGPVRPGLVHRLDKETSGVMVVARTDAAHESLAAQFRDRRVEKIYIALVHGRMTRDAGVFDQPIGRDPHRRTRMAIRRRDGRAARTDWRVLHRFAEFTLVRAELHTGRTHQIRVHLSAAGHPVAGDTFYGAPRRVAAGEATLPMLPRNFLHAACICFYHPVKDAPVRVCAALPAELREYLHRVARASGESPDAVDAYFAEFL